MWDWLAQNSGLVQAAAGIVTAIVWVVYLQILVSGFRRQRRTEILIHLGGSRGLDARTIVSNLGFEPIYVLEITLTIWSDGEKYKTSIADRIELTEDELSTPSATTLQGPLKSGEFVDIGSFETILHRARHNTARDLGTGDIERVEILVAAITAASSAIVAARRQFEVDADQDACQLLPTTLYATQIRSWWGRKKLMRELQDQLGQARSSIQ